MRFIIHEQPNERPLAAGTYRYELDGTPTGAVEKWRLTQVADEFEVLRVDLDARAAPSGHTYLFHYLRRENGRPERLTYRFWSAGRKIAGKLIFNETDVIGTRTVNERTYEENLDLASGYAFWFPSTAGLGLAVNASGPMPQAAVTLNGDVSGADALALQAVTLAAHMMITDTIDVDVAGRTVAAVPYQITWGDQRRMVIRDTNFWPVWMERPVSVADGPVAKGSAVADPSLATDSSTTGILSAVATRYIRYPSAS